MSSASPSASSTPSSSLPAPAPFSIAYPAAPQRWDVIVAGGGPAGVSAAIAAAREGARTLLLERTCSLGGMGTSALVPAWCPFSDKKQMLYGGIAAEIFALSKEGTPHVNPAELDWVPIDAEHLKRVYESVAVKAGVQILFDTFMVGVQRDSDSRVRHVIAANKQGLTALEASVFIDTTGDADLVAFAGGEFARGDAAGSLMPGTLCFILGGVNEEAYPRVPRFFTPTIEEIIASGRYPEIPDRHLCHNKVGTGCVGFNAGHLYDVDNTDPFGVSRAMIQGRRMALEYRNALREFFPEAFGQAHLVQTGALLGARETRRIIGEYTITLDDYLDRRSFPDDVCRNAYFIDIHLSREEASKAKDWDKAVCHRFKQYEPGESHGIPYRALVPRALRNVLVAGRCISTDKVVQGSVRVMPVCLATGQAAGTAAAMAALGFGGDVHAVEGTSVRARLAERGCWLPEGSAQTSPPAEAEQVVREVAGAPA
ncbi:FAD-dependent oxidoreductase [Verrucomicrobia bacterium LW23]|nr:FAD-dependent oxidoreductase [Verrucomicrobia bacterium LW23]